MGILDTQGFYYLMGGDLGLDDEQYANDVWRSTFSFHDHTAVAQFCHIDVPSDGVGLRCWPGEDGGCASSAVSGSSSGAALSGAVIAAIVIAVVAVVVLGLFAYQYCKKKAALGGGGLLAAYTKSDAAGSEAFLGTDRL